MTADISVARRYASALFEIARAAGSLDATSQSLREVVETLDASSELRTVLHNPRLAREKKERVLHAVFSGRVRTEVERFLLLVVDRDRALLLPQMLEAFDRLVDAHKGEAEGEAISAVPLSSAQIGALEAALLRRFGVRVRLSTRVEPTVLGGLQVRVGDKLIDDTVDSRLHRLSERLKRVKVV